MADRVGTPVFVTGAPRSGTSLTAQIIARCGAWHGETQELWENTAIRERVVKHVLDEAGVDKLGLTSWADHSPDPKWIREKVVGILREQGYDGGPWVYKGAKLVFMWRAWMQAFPQSWWVTVWRDIADVADSLERWSFSAPRITNARRVVAEYHTRARRIPALSVYPDRLIQGDTEEFKETIKRIGLDWDERAVRYIVDPARWGSS